MENNKGYVYVMINPSYEGLVKIGKTTKDPEERAKELSSATGIATPFIVAYKRMFNDCHVAEKTIHKILTNKGVRVSNSREFFRLPISDAIDTILNIADISTPTNDNEPTIINDSAEDEDPMYYTLAINYYFGDNGFTKDYNKALDFFHKSVLAEEKCEYLIWSRMSKIYEKLGNLQLAIKYAVKDVKESISCGMDNFTDLYDRYHSIFELCIKGGYESKAEEIFHLFFNGVKELSDEDWMEHILDDGSIYKESEIVAQYCVWMIKPYIERDEYQIILEHREELYKLRREILKHIKASIIEYEKMHLSNGIYFKMLEFLNGIRVNGEN